MKRLLFALVVTGLAILCLPVEMLAAGDTLNVDPLPPGNLNVVINGDTVAGGIRAHPDRVYRLARGKYYQITEPMKINGNITIIANDSANIRPPVLAPAILVDNSSVDHYFDLIGKGSKVAMSHLYMLSQRSDNNWLGWSDCFRIGADSVGLKLRGCVLEGWSNCAIVPNYWLKTDIQDCEFRNHQHSSAYFGGQIFRGNGAHLDTTMMINNTFIANNSYLIDVRGYCPLAVFEHNTCIYGVVNPFLCRNTQYMHINNNIFYAMHSYGGRPDDVINSSFLNYPDTSSSSIIYFRGRDTVSYWCKLWGGAAITGPEVYVDAPRGVTADMLAPEKRVYDVRNNDWYLPTKLTDFYKAFNDTVATYDSTDVPVYGQSGETKMYLKRVFYYPTWLNNYVKWTIDSLVGKQSPFIKVDRVPMMQDPGFPTNVDNHLDSLIQYLQGIMTSLGPNRWAFPNNTLYPITWPLPENLAYSNTSLQHAGTDGFAVGDLNWFPDQKAQWLLTDVKKTDNVLPMEFSLSQNYPNPFNPSTVIEFSLPKQSKVTLTVYNLLGQQVATLVNATLGAGSYTTEFNASKLASGTYIYRLTADNFVKTSKMLLIK